MDPLSDKSQSTHNQSHFTLASQATVTASKLHIVTDINFNNFAENGPYEEKLKSLSTFPQHHKGGRFVTFTEI